MSNQSRPCRHGVEGECARCEEVDSAVVFGWSHCNEGGADEVRRWYHEIREREHAEGEGKDG